MARQHWLFVLLASVVFELAWLLVWQLDRALLFVLFVP
jgi:hypothetical protein